MVKLFRVASPADLDALGAFEKKSDIIPSGRLKRTASIWAADRRRKNGVSRWDGKISVVFSTNGYKREAMIRREDSMLDLQMVAELKYTQALAYCEQNLLQMHGVSEKLAKSSEKLAKSAENEHRKLVRKP